MATLQPLTEPEPVRLEFTYRVDDEWIEREIGATGVAPSREWSIEFDLREVESPTLRRDVRAAHRRYRAWLSWYPTFKEPIADASKAARALVSAVKAQQRARAEATARTEQEAKERAEADARFAAERDLWVRAHGSRRLRLAAEGGYEHNRIYASERVMTDIPGGWVDTAHELQSRSRANPSGPALLLERDLRKSLADRKIQVTALRVIWVTTWPRAVTDQVEEQTPYDVTQGEAILISGWLGRWDVVYPVDPDYLAPTGEDGDDA